MFPAAWPLRTTKSTVPSDKLINENAVQLNIWPQLYENLCKSKPSDDCVASNIKRPRQHQQQQQQQEAGSSSSNNLVATPATSRHCNLHLIVVIILACCTRW